MSKTDAKGKEALIPEAELAEFKEKFLDGHAMYAEGTPPSLTLDHAAAEVLARGIQVTVQDLSESRLDTRRARGRLDHTEAVNRIYVRFVENVSADKAATADEIRESAAYLLAVMY